MSILYTCDNINLNTVELVANAIKSLLEINQEAPVSKVVIFSPEKSQYDVFIQQVNVYEKILGDSIRLEKVPLSMKEAGNTDNLTVVFKEDDSKYIDLTNGQKFLTAQLYLTASLLRIQNIYYASLLTNPQEWSSKPVWEKDYEYIQLPPFTGLSTLSRLSYFDLIFYIEEIEKIFQDCPKNSFLKKAENDLKKSILSFFQGDNFRSAVLDATISSEAVIRDLFTFLKDYPPAQRFSRDHKIYLTEQQDPLGAITYFFRRYSESSSHKRDYNLEAIVTVPGLLTPLRFFRNISAHAGTSAHKFEANEVRVCINLALEIFRRAKASREFWKKLSERR